MKNLSHLSPLFLQHILDKSDKNIIKELMFKTLNDLRDILKNNLSMYYNLTKDLQFNNYGVSMRESVSRKYK